MTTAKQRPTAPVAEERKTAEGAAYVSLLGKKNIAGMVFNDHQLGMPMVRIEVPATSAADAFTRYFHTQTIIYVQPLTQAQMIAVAESLKETPLPSFLSDLE